MLWKYLLVVSEIVDDEIFVIYIKEIIIFVYFVKQMLVFVTGIYFGFDSICGRDT